MGSELPMYATAVYLKTLTIFLNDIISFMEDDTKVNLTVALIYVCTPAVNISRIILHYIYFNSLKPMSEIKNVDHVGFDNLHS